MDLAKVSQGIYILEFMAIVLILQPPTETFSDPSKASEIEISTKIRTALKTESISAKSPTSDALVGSELL